jgi:spore coat polysaccharide biosynthesis protein SpsF (cytidylyltransferase family)
MSSDAAIVLQARMGSTRLPGKVLAPVGGQPVLCHCLERLVLSAAGPVVLATSASPEDDVLVAEAEQLGVAVVRGDRLDVLSRFVTAAQGLGSAFVIRATADNPVVDIDAPRRTLDALRASGADYCCERGLPYGAGVEAMKASVLFDTGRRAVSPVDREHVTTFIRRERTRYQVIEPLVPVEVRRPDLRLTVDVPDDLERIRDIARRLRMPLWRAPLTEVIAAADSVAAAEFVA